MAEPDAISSADTPAHRVPYPWWMPLVLMVATVAVYANSMAGVFVFDDLAHIVDRADHLSAVWPIHEVTGGERRPLVTLTLAVNYAISGLDTWSYHAFNVAAHGLAGLVLFSLVRRATSIVAPSMRCGAWLAFSIALLWLVHPLQTESVTYVIQRGESMAALSILVVLLALLRGSRATRPMPWYVIAVIAATLGMSSKATAAVIPPLAILFDGLVLSPSFRAALARRWWVHVALATSWIVLIPTGVFDAVFAPPEGESAAVGFGVKTITPLGYLAAQPAVILHYLRLVAWPSPLCIDMKWTAEDAPLGAVAPTILIGAALAASVVAAARRHWAGFVGLAFFLLLAPTSSVVPIRDLAFEHRMYLPLACVITLVVAAFGRRPGLVVMLLMSAAAVALGVTTIDRNMDYASARRLWTQTLEQRPDNRRARTNLAVACWDEGANDEAIELLSEVVAVHPGYLPAVYDLGVVLCEADRFEEALPYLRIAGSRMPHRVDAQLQLVTALRYTGHADEAVDICDRLVRQTPERAAVAVTLGNVLAEAERLDEAARAFRDAAMWAEDEGDLALAASAWFNLGNTLYRCDRLDEAASMYERALDANPEHAGARRWLDAIRSGAAP